MSRKDFFQSITRRNRSKSAENRREDSSPTPPQTTAPVYELDASSIGLKVLQEGSNPIVDIVAIHGLNGHREKTWTANNGMLWLRDLLPQRLPNVRIMTWGYDSRTHSRNPISTQYLHDHADTLVSDLCLERALTSTQRRPIVFIVHSLGGLVLKSALIHPDAARAVAQEDHRFVSMSTYGIIFAGTPHQGGEGVAWGVRLVNIASIFANTNKTTLQHLERDSEEVQRLLRDYAPISNEFVTKFAYDTLLTRLPIGNYVEVVPKASAVVPGAPNAEAIAINKDHSNMIKFSNADDDGYKKLSGYMVLMVREASRDIEIRWATHSRLGMVIPLSQLPRGIPSSQSKNAITGASTATPASQPPPTGNPAASTASSTSEAIPILHIACANKNIAGVTSILSIGKDPNEKTAVEEWTPL